MAKQIASLPDKVYAAKVVRKSVGVSGGGGLWTRLFGVFHRRNEAASAVTRETRLKRWSASGEFEYETEIWVGTVTWKLEDPK